MQVSNYSLKRNKELLFDDVSISFDENKINHILGENGSGKSSFSKSLIGVLSHEGEVKDISKPLIALGSYTNLPSDLKKDAIVRLSREKSFSSESFSQLMKILDIENIPNNSFSKMSDGQKQKMKLLFFLSLEPKTLILDEFTSALDRKTVNEIYIFLKDYLNLAKITIINITHNLEDLAVLDGSYFLIRDKKIVKFKSREAIIEAYTGRSDLLV